MCDNECICKGNWRLIVKESEPFFGRRYRNEKGHQYYFVGVLHAEDDYYYAMMRCTDSKLMMLSCVGSIETMGFTLIEDAPKMETDEEKLLKKIFGEEAG